MQRYANIKSIFWWHSRRLRRDNNRVHSSDEFSEDVDHSGRKSQFHFIKDLDDTLFEVNSRHHQWCSIIADNFKVTCMSLDGGYIPEAFEDDVLGIIAVQWHPERNECTEPINLFKYVKQYRIIK